VAAELRYGCAKKGSAELTRRVEALLAEIPVLPFDRPADAQYAALRVSLEGRGATIGQNDLLIAAQALAAGATVVTANRREFGRIEGLAVEDWLQDPD
jgi:tRNA(fMet)-specific endonuclease VapC